MTRRLFGARALTPAAAGLVGLGALLAGAWIPEPLTPPALAAAAQGTSETQAGPSDPAQQADDLASAIEAATASGTEPPDAALLRTGFDAFVARMDAFDAGRATRLARALYAAEPAVWSAFCVEGALRRAAPADATDPAARAAYAEAEAALKALLTPRTAIAERLAIEQRLALLRAGFGRHDRERAALGASLGLGGVDATQIVALASLARNGPDGTTRDPETAAALFASLLDRARQGPPEASDPPEAAPWALRGHGLAALEAALR